MIIYFLKYYDKLLIALLEHLEIVLITIIISLILAMILTVFVQLSKIISTILTGFFSMIYSIPSLALFSLLIPITGLGKDTAIIVLVLYNQYILLRNFIAGLDNVDENIIEAAKGMGMSNMQMLIKVKIPLAKKSLFTGIRLAVVSTIGIATIGALINAGGLGTILFDGLRTMNVNKILWGSILSAGLALFADKILQKIENKSF
ncbi:MAG: ABC transporter permease [Erysipelotrichaceae bacterium]|nr:ABC transporter permease [Erysipelotrichaceae bacterium]